MKIDFSKIIPWTHFGPPWVLYMGFFDAFRVSLASLGASGPQRCQKGGPTPVGTLAPGRLNDQIKTKTQW